MKVTMPDDSDVFADFMQRVGDNGYMICIDPIFDPVGPIERIRERRDLDIECTGLDKDTVGNTCLVGYRVDENGNRISNTLEMFKGVDNITVY